MVAVCSPPAALPEQAPASDAALIDALRAGGYNIYFRHAQTDWAQDDSIEEHGDWTECDPLRVRQLSEHGRRTAIAVGRAIRALGIPVGKILASPYCRTVETAELMALGPVTKTTDIMNLNDAHYFGGTQTIVTRARARLAAVPHRGTNTILVAHGNVAREATPVYPGEAEGVVFQPMGDGTFTVLERLTPERWTALAEQFANGER